MEQLHQLFDALVETSGSIVWMADGEGKVLAIAPRERAAGLEAWAGRGWTEALHPEDRDAVLARYQEAYRSGGVVELVYRALRSGEYRWFKVRATPKTKNAGQVHWVGVAEDVHEAVLATEELKRSERVYRAFAEASASVLWRSDPDGGATFIQGWSNVADKHGFSWLEIVHPEDREQVLKEIEALKAAGVAGALRYRALTPAGGYRRCLCRAIPIRDDEGRLVEWVGTLTDMEEQLTSEEALHRADRLKSVGRLAAGIAHDFNNLLTVVIGGAEALANALPPGDPLHEQATLTLHAAERGADLVRRLLAYSRQQPLQPRAVRVDELFGSVEPLIRPLLGADIELTVTPRHPPLACMADPAQLETALVNLCINARDAMPFGGQITLEAERVEFSDEAAPHLALTPGSYVVLSVTDDGLGMAPEVLEHAIDPFFTTKAPGEGSGLGLSTVYGFVRQSGGHMALWSSPNKGTIVKLYLPCARAAPNTDAIQGAIAAPIGARRVLVVEDDPLVRRQVTRHLTSLGCEVVATGDAQGALRLLTDGSRYDVLMTDLVLPGGVDGFELAKRAHAMQPSLPILFTSGYSEERLSVQGQQARGRFLQKPYRRQMLARAISETLDATGN